MHLFAKRRTKLHIKRVDGLKARSIDQLALLGVELRLEEFPELDREG